MSDHLPECNQRDTAWEKSYYSGVECVCEALRACEQRVREEWYEAQSEAWEQGFHHALDAAREATSTTRGWFTDEYPDSDGEVKPVALIEDVVAIIDALVDRHDRTDSGTEMVAQANNNADTGTIVPE